MLTKLQLNQQEIKKLIVKLFFTCIVFFSIVSQQRQLQQSAKKSPMYNSWEPIKTNKKLKIPGKTARDHSLVIIRTKMETN